MLRHDDGVPVTGREHATHVKRHADAGNVRAQLLRRRFSRRARPLRAELRIRIIALMTERKAEMQTGSPGDVE
jgi:hypothetical protein